jgi:hypothetical protein
MTKIINFLKEHKEGIITGILGIIGMKTAYECGKANRPVHATMIFIKQDELDEEKEAED